ncbi:MAG: T9SS type A sorting domain-containing protein [Bacteroidota bacterium]|nr:T9SS type A sorting domain-containing protein [Bacteroidota bacterium]MDP4234680.1 T9SS type A sorting domain-containing protein [Bacteroidota bacterium]MDP4243844.1 T9SS type A sorting domain-containing protein [Bacteroidota bacterium]MDP4288564.1 T9SS type A sorting domain-containing protein [Bacteroidota bacterium]
MMSKILLALYSFSLGAILYTTASFHRSAEKHLMHCEPLTENLAAKNYWEWLRLRDPATGEIPRGIHVRELAYARTLVRGPQGDAMADASTSIHTKDWQSVGPFNAGGRTQAIGVDVANNANVLIATAQGGVWRSTDSGMSWNRSTAPDELKDIMSLVQDRRAGKTNTWYCGTGELLSTTDRRTTVVGPPRWRTTDIGNGIYKSTDGGKKFFVLPSTQDQTGTTLDSVFDGVWNVVTDNSKSAQDIVYAAGFGAIMRSTNGGTSWSHVLGDPAHRSFCTDVEITPTGILYAYLSQYTLDGATPTTAGVWRSIDGVNWKNITPMTWPTATQRLKIAIAPSDETVVYVAGSNDGAGNYPVFFKYTYVSGDGSGTGGKWEDRSSELPPVQGDVAGASTLGGYAVALKVHPLNPDVVFFGGTNLYRSPDGFSNSSNVEWVGGYNYDQNVEQSYPNHHPDNHDVAFCSNNPSKMYSANDGGIYFTQDCLADQDPNHPITWANLNTGDPASIIYVVAIDRYRDHDTSIVGGFQDQGSWYHSPGDTGNWQMVGGGDGCYCAMDSQSVIVASQFGYAYRESIDSNLWWSLQPEGISQPQFVTPFMLDPADQDQFFYVENNHLWRNSDINGVPPFTSTSTNWAQLTQCFVADGTFITALGMSVIPAHRLYFGTSDGHLYRVDGADGVNPAAVEITGSIFPNNAFISCVAVDPENADKIVACFSNYHVVSLFASDDGGIHWRNISGNLETNADGSGDGPSTRWVTIVHHGGETLYLVGTSVGLFSTSDISGSTVWSPEGLSTIGRITVENIDARQSDGYVAVATQGEGVFTTYVTTEAGLNQGVNRSAAIAHSFSVSPNPAHDVTRISVTLAEPRKIRLRAVDPTGRIALVIYDGTAASGASSFEFDAARLASGTYYVELMSDEGVETRRLVITK